MFINSSWIDSKFTNKMMKQMGTNLNIIPTQLSDEWESFASHHQMIELYEVLDGTSRTPVLS